MKAPQTRGARVELERGGEAARPRETETQQALRAAERFDVSLGVRFSTYASWHVRAFVLRALRDKSHIVRLPQTLQVDMMQIRKARYRYAVRPR